MTESKPKKFFEGKSFETLNKEWNKKLQSAGFQDIETDSYIKNDSVKKQEFQYDPARVQYFKACNDYLNQTTFEDATDRFVFENHCDGKSNRVISEMLINSDDPNLKPLSASAVDRRILKMLGQADIKPYRFNL